jgi:hypothetical protein
MRRWFFLSIALAACSTFSSGDDTSSPADGGPESAPPPPPPASDAGDDVQVTPLCETLKNDTSVLFCADFDGLPDAPPFGFDTKSPYNAFSITSAGKDGRGLQVTTNAAGGAVQLEKNAIFTSTASVQLDLDVNVAQCSLDYATLAALHLAGSGEAEYGIGVFGRGTVVSQPRNVSTSIPGAGWHHLVVKLTATDGGAPFAQDVTIDGTNVTATTNDPTGNNGTQLIMGIMEIGATGTETATIIFDNVVLRQLP